MIHVGLSGFGDHEELYGTGVKGMENRVQIIIYQKYLPSFLMEGILYF